MRIEKKEAEYSLSYAVVDDISEAVFGFCGQIKTESRDAQRYRLSAEECLLYWLENGCEGRALKLCTGTRMGAPYIRIELEGEALNPYADQREEYGVYRGSVLVSLGLSPEYSYDRNRNVILFRLKRKRPGQMRMLLTVIAAAVIVGAAGRLLLPDAFRTAALDIVILPLYDTFFKVLSCIAGPMIFLSVAWGIYGLGDAATLGRIGKNMMLRFVGTVFLIAGLGILSFPILGPGLSGGSASGGSVSDISEMILGIFPSTIIEPFASGNTLQIIFLAFVIGIALLFLGKQTTSIARAIEQINYLVQFLMRIISRIVPYVVFLVVLNMIWSDSMQVMKSAWKIIISVFAAILLSSVLAFIYTSLRNKVPVMLLIKKSLPTFVLALSTSSSAACLGSNITTCTKKFGIDESLCSFGIPLGMVVHKPVCALYYLMMTFFFAREYGVSCSVTWIVTAVAVASVIAIATPPIPGGGVLAYTVLFGQLGIPSEALAIAFAFEMFTDFFITAFEMLLLPLSLINVSSGMGMIDKSVLRAE